MIIAIHISTNSLFQLLGYFKNNYFLIHLFLGSHRIALNGLFTMMLALAGTSTLSALIRNQFQSYFHILKGDC